MSSIIIPTSMLADTFWTQSMPLTPLDAFMYLIGNAVSATVTVSINGMFVDAFRGDIVTNLRRLSEDWKWGKNKVSAFLSELHIKKFISLKKESRYTHITVINYECWIEAKTPLRDNLGTISGQSKVPLTNSESISNTTEYFDDGTISGQSRDNLRQKKSGGTISGQSKVPLTNSESISNTTENFDDGTMTGQSPQKSPIYILLKGINTTIELLSNNVNEGEKNSFRNFLIYIAENAPNIFALKHPFTFTEYLSITTKFSRPEIEEIIDSMGNFKPLTKKYISAYKTFLSWGKMREAKKTAYTPKNSFPTVETPQPPSQQLFSQLLNQSHT